MSVEAAPPSKDLPLAGYRVVDLSWVIAGPACTKFLADQGAEVIKVESETLSDAVRHFGPWLDGKNTAPEGGAAFILLNRNKRSITLDLKNPRGFALLMDLVKISDVVVDNFAAGTMDRLGLGYEVLKAANPRIIMAQLSGFGQDGPYAKRVAYGQSLLSMTGHYDQIGEASGTPLLPGYTYTDQAAGTIGAFAIMAALYHREKTGEGQHLDLSLFQMGSSLMGEFLIEADINGVERSRSGNSRPDALSQGAYQCLGENEWCVIAIWSPQDWHELLDVINQDDPGLSVMLSELSITGLDQAAIDPLLEKWTIGQTPQQVMERLQARGVEAAVVQGPKHLLTSDQHLHARGYFQRFTHIPSGRELPIDGIPYALSDAPRTIRHGPPRLGEANDYVFRDLLRLPDDEIETLRQSGIIGKKSLG